MDEAGVDIQILSFSAPGVEAWIWMMPK